MLSAQRRTVPSSMKSTGLTRRTLRTLPIRLFLMREPTTDDIDALVGPATPHFAYQLRARVEELVKDLPADHPVRRYGQEKMELLDRLRRDIPGWEELPSSAPADQPLPRRQ